MEHAIELAKELLTFEFPANLTKKEQKAKNLNYVTKCQEFEMYCYLHNFNPQHIEDMAGEHLEESK